MANLKKHQRHVSRSYIKQSRRYWQAYKYRQRCELDQRRFTKRNDEWLRGDQWTAQEIESIKATIKPPAPEEVRTSFMHRLAELKALMANAAIVVALDEVVIHGYSMVSIRLIEHVSKPAVEVRHIPLEQWRRKGRNKKRFN